MTIRIAAALAASSLIFAPAALADTATPTTLSVEGNGSVNIKPDLATLNVNVHRTATTSRVALSEANRATDRIVAAVKALGVPASGIQTESIDVSRTTIKVGPRKHQHRVRRYAANESLQLTSSATLAGPVIDAATHAGATGIDGPDFSFSNPDAGVVAANNAALTDARTQANAAAATLGYVVTGVQSVDLDPSSGIATGSSGTSTASSAPAATQSTPTTVNAGTEEVDATVDVVFTIGPAAV
jgi:uncharacterized protein